MAISIGEHAVPVVAGGLGQAEFYSVIAARAWWLSGAGRIGSTVKRSGGGAKGVNLVRSEAGIHNLVNFGARWSKQRGVFDQVIETAPVPASLKGQMPLQLVVNAKHGFMLAIGLQVRHNRFQNALVHVLKKDESRVR